jgi:spore coat polysaccharide biosynthesis protein SpsF
MIQKHLMNPRPYNLVVVPGDESDVFSRYETFYRKTNCHYMMRITADCPVWNPFLATQLFLNMMEHHADYAHISTPDDFPDGLDVEIIREDLMQALINYPKKHEGIKEHVTISFKGSEGPKASCIYRLPQIMEFSSYPKLSIDTPEDLERVLQTKDKLWWVNKNGF